MSQLAKLAKRFPAAYIEKPPKGKYGEFVAHHTINQALLATVGPFDLAVREILRGTDGRIEGAIVALTCDIDGRRTTIEEAGDCERPDNWPTEGARLKDAMSDGLKRCAMRLGCGLHLWSQEHYFLDKSLGDPDATASTPEPAPTPEPTTQVTPQRDPRPLVPAEGPSSADPLKAKRLRLWKAVEAAGEDLTFLETATRHRYTCEPGELNETQLDLLTSEFEALPPKQKAKA